MKINNNTDLKKTRDIFQKIVDILDEGIEIDKREKAGEEISEEETEAWAGKLMVAMVKLQSLEQEE